MTAAACERDDTSNCFVGYNLTASDPGYAFNVRHKNPKTCPIALSSAPEYEPYAAVVTAAAWAVESDLAVSIQNANAATVADGDFPYGPDPDDPYNTARADASGNYPAGTVNRLFGYGTRLQDIAQNITIVDAGKVAAGTVYLPYNLPALTALYPVTGTEIGASYTQGVSVDSHYYPTYPLVYDWYQDGNYIGSSPSITTSFNSFGDHTLEAVVTDATGLVERWSSVVPVSYAGGCDREPCDPPVQ